jgi:hypothetical protein
VVAVAEDGEASRWSGRRKTTDGWSWREQWKELEEDDTRTPVGGGDVVAQQRRRGRARRGPLGAAPLQLGRAALVARRGRGRCPVPNPTTHQRSPRTAV